MLKDDVVTFTAHLSINIKGLTGYKQKVVLAAILDGESMRSNMAANTNHTYYYFVEKSKCHKMSPLNTFPLKLWM